MKKIINDFGPINLGLLAVTIFSLLVSAGLLWWSMENESYIRTVDQSLADRNAEVQELNKELKVANKKIAEKDKTIELKSMQLIHKSDVYNQQKMRDEGIKYQNMYEGLDAE